MPVCAIDSHVHLLEAPFNENLYASKYALINLLQFRPHVLDYFEYFKYTYFIRKTNPLIHAVEKLIMLAIADKIKNSSQISLTGSMLGANIKYSVVHPVYPYFTSEEVYKVCDFKAFFPFSSPPVDKPDCLSQAEKDLSKGCLGIKIHPLLQGLDLDSRIYKELVSLAAARGVPVVTHFGGSPAMFGIRNGLGHLDARKIKELARHSKKTRLVVAHCGLWQNEEVLEQIKGLDNVYIDTSFQSPAFIKKAAGVIGSGRILLGSDFPVGNQKLCRQNVIESKLSDSQTEDILYRNALEIMDFKKAKNNYYSHLANNIR